MKKFLFIIGVLAVCFMFNGVAYATPAGIQQEIVLLDDVQNEPFGPEEIWILHCEATDTQGCHEMIMALVESLQPGEFVTLMDLPEKNILMLEAEAKADENYCVHIPPVVIIEKL